MTTYIVDASVVIERLILGSYTGYARVLFQRALGGDQFVVPEFCLLECTNVVWKHVRFQGMPPGQAKLIIKDLSALPLKRIPIKAVLNTALEIGLTYQLAIYDSAYVALALRSHYPLITIDQPQSRAAIAEGVP
jgi:predicted nucleic acid-binding protein